jgi:hypothetical protein
MNSNRLSDLGKLMGGCHFSGALAKMPHKPVYPREVAEPKSSFVFLIYICIELRGLVYPQSEYTQRYGAGISVMVTGAKFVTVGIQ